jgi:crotonobetainyl-CoA:carnitine CoA-transferase CaiB-like acyl-CoA transferase
MTVPLLHAKYGRAPARVGLLHPSIAPYGLYRCSDQLEILIGIQNEREWVAFCDVVLHAKDAASLPIFLDNSLRVQNRASLDELIGKIVRTLSSTELRQRLERADIAYGFLNDLAAVLRHAEVGALDVTTASGVVSMPAAIGYRQGAQDGTLSSVPALNQQGESIRSEFAPFTRAVMKDH